MVKFERNRKESGRAAYLVKRGLVGIRVVKSAY
jgi:hypothetical protein